MRGRHLVITRPEARGLIAAGCSVGVALIATACGSSSAATKAPSPSPSSHASPATQLDACVVGSWKSTGVTGTTTYTSKPASPTVTWSGGGGGDALKIGPDGTADFEYGNETPQQGTGSDGAAYVVTTTGSMAGRAITAGNQLTFILTDSSGMHISVTRNGAVFAGGSLDAPQQYIYTCTAGKSMTWTQKLSNFDEVTTWVAA